MMIDCIHWSGGLSGAGRCALGLYGGMPSHGTCLHCDQREPVSAPPAPAPPPPEEPPEKVYPRPDHRPRKIEPRSGCSNCARKAAERAARLAGQAG